MQTDYQNKVTKNQLSAIHTKIGFQMEELDEIQGKHSSELEISQGIDVIKSKMTEIMERIDEIIYYLEK